MVKIKKQSTEKRKNVKEYYDSLTFEIAKKVTALITGNAKLKKTKDEDIEAWGIALYPAFKGSCSHAGTCRELCIAFTGPNNLTKGSKNFNLSPADMAGLKRLWLFKNATDYFYKRANIELAKIELESGSKIVFREITSECIDLSKIEVDTYGYFKDYRKITNQVPRPNKAIYSWSEKSNALLIDLCKENNIPIAVVMPKKVVENLLKEPNKYAGIVFHNGDNSDLQSHMDYKKGIVNIHLLSEKVARYSNVMERPTFLDSYKNLLKELNIQL